MTRDEIVRPNIRRRVALAGGTALIAAAGAGGYLAMAGGSGSVRLTAVPTVVTGNVQAPDTATGTKAPDTDNVQQGGQSGVQDTTGVDTTSTTGTETTSAEAPSTEADGSGGNADVAGSAGQDGNFNN